MMVHRGRGTCQCVAQGPQKERQKGGLKAPQGGKWFGSGSLLQVSMRVNRKKKGEGLMAHLGPCQCEAAWYTCQDKRYRDNRKVGPSPGLP